MNIFHTVMGTVVVVAISVSYGASIYPFVVGA